MLKTIEDLQRNEKNIEYVIPHIKGDPYFLIIGTIGRKNFGYLKTNMHQKLRAPYFTQKF